MGFLFRIVYRLRLCYSIYLRLTFGHYIGSRALKKIASKSIISDSSQSTSEILLFYIVFNSFFLFRFHHNFFFILILYTKNRKLVVLRKMADTEEDNPIDCSLHKCIFEDDYRKLSQLIRTHDVGQKDKHGKYRAKVYCL